ncbi:MAG: DUF5615 family PIN-like protein [Bacteroidota bacterium]
MIKILADEGLSGLIVQNLREAGLAVDWILELSPGIRDEEVIEASFSTPIHT